MSDSPINKKLAIFLDDVVNEVNEELLSDQEEFDQFIASLSSHDDKYSQKEFIAEGGMKNIYRAKERQTLRNVAMAQLKRDGINKSSILAFIKEARITALLEHPNIVPVHEINQQDGLPYFTMKEIQGETLGFILSKLRSNSYKYKKLYNLNALLNIFIKVCDAVAYAHSKNIIHLDLKPDNIHVGEFGEVLVIDWGLAKDLNSPNETVDFIPEELDLINEGTMDGFVKGTIGYMAPEQARGENNFKDQLTDIYSLGAILYTILELRAPYENESPKNALRKIASGDYIPLNNEAGHPNALISVVQKAMELNKTDRYNSVEEIKEDVQLYLDGFATKAQDASIGELLVLYFRRNKTLCTLAGAFMIIIFISTSFFIVSLKASEEKATKNALLAVKNAEEAELREAEARKLYEDLTNTIKAKDELTETSIPLVIKQSLAKKREMEFDKAFEILDEVYSEKITDPHYWLESGYLLLGKLKPNSALKYFKKAAELENDQALNPLITDAIKISEDFTDFSENTEYLKKYIKAVNSLNNPFIMAGIAKEFNINWITRHESKIELLKFSLNLVNKSAKLKIKITKLGTAQRFRVDLRDNPDLRDVSPMCGFPVDDINLAGCTGLESLIFLKSCGLKKLNLSETDGDKFKFRQNVYNVLIDSIEELMLRNMNLRHIRLGGKRNLKVLDLSGSTVNAQNITSQSVRDLNLCGAVVEDANYIRRFGSLRKLIIPEKYLTNQLQKYLNSKKIRVIKCNCQGLKHNCTLNLRD